jgi:acyl carrier protein
MEVFLSSLLCFVMKIEEEFGVEIPDERAEEVQNLSDAVKLINELSS